MKQRIETVWETWSYDVWGNAKDGYEVNNRFNLSREWPLTLTVKKFNKGTPQEFESAYPSDKQIREALDIKPRVRLDLDGDDLVIYVNHASTGYPLGEMHCVSHKSLSPIEAV